MDYECELGCIVSRGNTPGRASADRASRGSHARRLSRERLVGARHPALGVSTARAISIEKFRDLDFTVDRHHGRAGAVPRPRDTSGPKVTRRRYRISIVTRIASAEGSRLRSRSGSRPRPCGGEHRPGSIEPRQVRADVLDVRPDADASHQQWLQSLARRPARQRHRIRPRGRRARMPAGADIARNRARQATRGENRERFCRMATK